MPTNNGCLRLYTADLEHPATATTDAVAYQESVGGWQSAAAKTACQGLHSHDEDALRIERRQSVWRRNNDGNGLSGAWW